MRLAGPQDHDALLAHLRAHEATSMFPLVNLMGLGHPMRVWVAAGGMVGLSQTGMVLPQWPGGDWPQAAGALAGCGGDGIGAGIGGGTIAGFLGPLDQVTGLRRALGLADTPARHAGDEPGYRLTLTDLRLPDCAGYRLEPITDGVRDLVTGWRTAYEAELFATPPGEAAAKAGQDVARWQANDSHRVLWHQGQPVALTGFNARLPEVVQVGAVYVPPLFRNRGHARRAVGLHLDQARAAGVQRAVLFAASDPAARAYAALGFRPFGRMGLVLFATPQRVAR